MPKKTIEGRAAETLLQKPERIKVAGVEFDVCQPTPATLILVSGLISEMPHIESNPENVVYEVLKTAKDCQIIGKIAATLILGAKRINERRKIKTGLFGLKKSLEVDWLAKTLMEDYTTKQLSRLVTERLEGMQIGDFFGLTASLSAVNLLRSTRPEEERGA